MAAVAAIIATRAHNSRNDARGSSFVRGGSSHALPVFREPEPLRRSGEMSKRSICFTCFLSLAFTMAGAGVMVASFTNDREERINAFVGSVRSWTGSARTWFASSAFAVNATVLGGDAAGPLAPVQLTAAESEDPDFKLVLAGVQVEELAPLRFRGEVEFAPYLNGNATAAAESGGVWPLLPSRADAATATFQFAAVDGNGTVGSWLLSGVPLVYDEALPPLQPSPKNKCSVLQRGVWQDGSCHRVQRLARICVQVVPDSAAAGGWTLRRRPVAVGGIDVLGCDAANDWTPMTYQVDACWGASSSESCPDQPTRGHVVEVMVRSFEDPVVRAAELTGNRFDFGVGAGTERILALALLATGLLLSAAPLIQLGHICRRVRSVKDADEAVSPCPERMGHVARWAEP